MKAIILVLLLTIVLSQVPDPTIKTKPRVIPPPNFPKYAENNQPIDPNLKPNILNQEKGESPQTNQNNQNKQNITQQGPQPTKQVNQKPPQTKTQQQPQQNKTNTSQPLTKPPSNKVSPPPQKPQPNVANKVPTTPTQKLKITSPTIVSPVSKPPNPTIEDNNQPIVNAIEELQETQKSQEEYKVYSQDSYSGQQMTEDSLSQQGQNEEVPQIQVEDVDLTSVHQESVSEIQTGNSESVIIDNDGYVQLDDQIMVEDQQSLEGLIEGSQLEFSNQNEHQQDSVPQEIQQYIQEESQSLEQQMEEDFNKGYVIDVEQELPTELEDETSYQEVQPESLNHQQENLVEITIEQPSSESLTNNNETPSDDSQDSYQKFKRNQQQMQKERNNDSIKYNEGAKERHQRKLDRLQDQINTQEDQLDISNVNLISNLTSSNKLSSVDDVNQINNDFEVEVESLHQHQDNHYQDDNHPHPSHEQIIQDSHQAIFSDNDSQSCSGYSKDDSNCSNSTEPIHVTLDPTQLTEEPSQSLQTYFRDSIYTSDGNIKIPYSSSIKELQQIEKTLNNIRREFLQGYDVVLFGVFGYFIFLILYLICSIFCFSGTIVKNPFAYKIINNTQGIKLLTSLNQSQQITQKENQQPKRLDQQKQSKPLTPEAQQKQSLIPAIPQSNNDIQKVFSQPQSFTQSGLPSLERNPSPKLKPEIQNELHVVILQQQEQIQTMQSSITKLLTGQAKLEKNLLDTQQMLMSILKQNEPKQRSKGESKPVQDQSIELQKDNYFPSKEQTVSQRSLNQASDGELLQKEQQKVPQQQAKTSVPLQQENARLENPTQYTVNQQQQGVHQSPQVEQPPINKEISSRQQEDSLPKTIDSINQLYKLENQTVAQRGEVEAQPQDNINDSTGLTTSRGQPRMLPSLPKTQAKSPISHQQQQKQPQPIVTQPSYIQPQITPQITPKNYQQNPSDTKDNFTEQPQQNVQQQQKQPQLKTQLPMSPHVSRPQTLQPQSAPILDSMKPQNTQEQERSGQMIQINTPEKINSQIELKSPELQFNPIVTNVQLPKPVIQGLPKKNFPVQRPPQRQANNPFEQKQ